MSRPPSPKGEPATASTEAELSRIAREAVHQPADPRLEGQLARMGVIETSDPIEDQPSQPTVGPVVSGPGLEHLDARLRRIEVLLAALVVSVGILALLGVILLFR